MSACALESQEGNENNFVIFFLRLQKQLILIESKVRERKLTEVADLTCQTFKLSALVGTVWGRARNIKSCLGRIYTQISLRNQ